MPKKRKRRKPPTGQAPQQPGKPRRPPLYRSQPDLEPARDYFRGELMTCVLCGRQEQSDPAVESDWRVMEADGVAYYACPNEFPPDGASRAEFKRAYLRFSEKVIEVTEMNEWLSNRLVRN